MPPKRRRSTNLDDSETESLYPDVSVQEDERTAPKKRGRKSIIDAILQEEARGTPTPVLPQNQWTVTIVHPQDSTGTAKRRKVQSTAPSSATQKHPSPGTPSIWAANEGEFYSAFKSLTESFGGICFANLGTFPVLAWLVEGPRSPEDMLDGETLRLSLVTEFKPKDQPGVASSTPGPKKKGPQNRRTKRGDLTTVSTNLDNGANTIFPNNTRTGTGPPLEDLKSVPQKQWPCLVQSPVYNPEYPTFCECLQPHCLRHCPAARDLLFRRCTDYSWPDPGIVGFNDWMIPPEPGAGCGTSVQTGHPGDLNKDPSVPSENRPGVQAEGASTSTPPVSHRLPPGTTKIYAQVIPELASLLDHMERKDPILVISTTDVRMDSVLPFQLPPEYGCVVLGFFDVEDVECENGNHPLAPSIQPGTLSWKARLRYATPSNAKDANGNLAPPWWLPRPPTPATLDPSPSLSGPEPEKDGVAGKAAVSEDKRWCVIQALDGNKGRTWWHCLGCGRINQRDMLIHRRCSSCRRKEEPAPTFVIEEVLQDTSTAPFPLNHAPLSMKPGDMSVKEFGDKASVYCYNFRDVPLSVTDPNSEKGACVRHIFTGPYADPKVQATDLFYQIQEGVELSWQGVKTGIAEGPYYSWTSPRHGWVDEETPGCILEARKLISQFVRSYGEKGARDERDFDRVPSQETPEKPAASASSQAVGREVGEVAEDIRINHVVVLAWTGSGSKRGTFLTAKESPVFVLCLGATVELDLERCLPEPATVASIEDDPPVAVPEAVGVEPGQRAKGKKVRKGQKEPVAQTSPETKVNPKGKRKEKGKEKAAVQQPKPKPSAPAHERLKISMVHGDVLILSGGDFIYSLTRTGMSILLFGLPDAQY